jgi:hypothetical protein
METRTTLEKGVMARKLRILRLELEEELEQPIRNIQINAADLLEDVGECLDLDTVLILDRPLPSECVVKLLQQATTAAIGPGWEWGDDVT